VIKKILILAVAALLSFGGAFAFSWFTKHRKASLNTTTPEQAAAMQDSDQTIPSPQTGPDGKIIGNDDQIRKQLSQEQLKALIDDVREKIEEYNTKTQDLKVREERIKTAHDMLKKDIEELENLRIELASAMAKLKTQREEFEKERIEINKDEGKNLVAIASAYDKMDPTSAGKILASMTQATSGNYGDAVKILHYMGDRPKANLLAELATTEPSIAAYFCQKLKHIVEEK